jgi:hypothetical protein
MQGRLFLHQELPGSLSFGPEKRIDCSTRDSRIVNSCGAQQIGRRFEAKSLDGVGVIIVIILRPACESSAET